jgi:hypothetical protein
VALAAPVKEVGIGGVGWSGGRASLRGSFSGRKDLGFEREEAGGFAKWQLPKNNSADQTEYRGGGADTKSQRKRNDETEAEVGLQLTQCEEEIANHSGYS